MKRHRLLALVQAIIIAMAITLSFASPAAAHPYTDPSWNTSERGWLSEVSLGYNYRIPVCLESVVGGPTWNVAGDARHARIASVMTTWNGINGELFYWQSGLTCDVWAASGEPFLRISKFDFTGATYGYTDGEATLCFEPWGASCSKQVNLYYDSVLPSGKTWYTGTGTPGASQVDFWSVILHEFGHTMRCHPHSSNSADVMYHTYDGVDRTLTATDKLCYSHYYGTSH